MSPTNVLTIRLSDKFLREIAKTRKAGRHSSDSDVVEAALREVLEGGFPKTLRTKYVLLSSQRSFSDVSAFRIDSEVLSRARAEAEHLEINFSQFVLHSLCRFLGMKLGG